MSEETVQTSGMSAVGSASPQSLYIHSNIFSQLVQFDDDLTGLVAYGLYQQRKRSWIEAYSKEHGVLPEVEPRKAYAFTYTPKVIDALRKEAESFLLDFAELIKEEAKDEMQLEALNGRLAKELLTLTSKINKISGYRHHVVGHVVGFFSLVILVICASMIIDHEPSVAEFVKQLFGHASAVDTHPFGPEAGKNR